MRRVTVSAMLLFALLFQSLAHAMPCCAAQSDMSTESTHAHEGVNLPEALDAHAGHSDSQNTADPCTVASPLCCAVPSLILAEAPFKPLAMAAVHVPTIHPLALGFQPSSPERPPRV